MKNPNASACSVFRGRPVRSSRKSSGNSPRCWRKSPSWISIRWSMRACAQRGVRAIYGDITQRDVLLACGRGRIGNHHLLAAQHGFARREQSENAPADPRVESRPRKSSSTPNCFRTSRRFTQAGASYVSAPRLLEAADLLHAIEAAEKTLLEEKRATQLEQLEARNEVIP